MVILPDAVDDASAQQNGEQGLLAVEEDYKLTEEHIQEIGKVMWICPSGHSSRTRLYYPFNFPELPGRLADLQEGDQAAVLNFVRKWGSLG